jgi:hypothetical protein
VKKEEPNSEDNTNTNNANTEDDGDEEEEEEEIEGPVLNVDDPYLPLDKSTHQMDDGEVSWAEVKNKTNMVFLGKYVNATKACRDAIAEFENWPEGPTDNPAEEICAREGGIRQLTDQEILEEHFARANAALERNFVDVHSEYILLDTIKQCVSELAFFFFSLSEAMFTKTYTDQKLQLYNCEQLRETGLLKELEFAMNMGPSIITILDHR